jgi:hypothetical protein
VLGTIVDERYARYRLEIAFGSPTYNLFGNNCEHFARFVATGVHESTQLRTAAVVAGVAAIAALALQSD